MCEINCVNNSSLFENPVYIYIDLNSLYVNEKKKKSIDDKLLEKVSLKYDPVVFSTAGFEEQTIDKQ